MQNFWYQMHFGDVPMMYTVDGEELKDLHTVVMAFFNPAENSWALAAVALYVLAQAALALHLLHGFESAFQSMGLRHARYTPWIQSAGRVFSLAVPAGFAALPIFLYLIQL
jgi:succinate dehydrogenase / fumarate reductase cytochrome b subunit